MNALTRLSVFIITIGFLLTFGVMGYITYQKALKVGDTYKKYHQELAEIYVAENLREPPDANI